MQQVRQERSGWRDLGLSLRHRQWGAACSAFDIDFLLVECSRATPLAIIEYKKVDGKEPTFAQLAALRTLATDAKIAFYVAWYTEGYRHFWLEPHNQKAWQLVRNEPHAPRCWWDELSFVTFLHRIRGVAVPPDVAAGLYSEAAEAWN